MNSKIKEFFLPMYLKVLSILPLKWNLKVRYYRENGVFPNLNNPKKFSEKILCTMCDKKFEDYNIYVDKYLVRNEIANLIGKKYLNKIIGVYDSVEEIDFDKLPEKFVLKGTNGSGCNIVVKDKSKLNLSKCKKDMKKWLKINYYLISREPQYKKVKSRIICEEYLEDETGELRDYKIFCFNGNPEFIQVDTNRFSGHKQDFYSTDWKKLKLEFVSENSNIIMKKPEKLEEMLNLAKKISSKFNFARVDFYYVNNKIYFGEITFHPMSGKKDFKPQSENERIANLIKL